MPLHPSWRKLLIAALTIALPWLPGCTPVPHVTTPPPAPPAPPPVAPAIRPVVLVQPSFSVADDAERNYYQRMSAKLAEWLRETGIPVVLVDDDAASRCIGKDTRVVILCSNQSLGMVERSALTHFLKQGGKVIAFNAADPHLASAMLMRLGSRRLAVRPGQWSAFRFNPEAPHGAPARIIQDSRGLQTVYPAGPDAKVIAWWEDACGRQTEEPAWVRSSRGFWMSHMVLEGDIPAKKQMLVALLGACDPVLWQAAASQALRTAGTLGRFPDPPQALGFISRLPCPPLASSKIAALCSQSEQLTDEMTRQYRLSQYDRVIVTARLLDAAVMEAYARTASPRHHEFRGLWNHSGTGLFPGDWNATCQTLARNGFTAIFPNIQRPWSALYASPTLNASPVVAALGDQLAACLSAARQHGIQVHAWAICWNMEGAPADLLSTLRRQNRLQVSAAGASINWLCPSDPRNRAQQSAAIRELAMQYRIDGIHLDYIRYPSKDACFCQGCRQRFSHAIGRTVKRWPADVQTGTLSESFRQWRREQISGWLAELHHDLRRIAPTVRLSAAVYPGYPGCRDSIGQDWGEWARRNLVDFVCPMNYTGKSAQFEQWCAAQAALPGAQQKLIPGIGVTANESRLDAAGVIDQITILRKESLGGFILFDANHTVANEILPYLRMGATAD